MRCSVCGHDNSADARFCSQCGNPVGVASRDDATRRVAAELPGKMRAARAGGRMRGERRTVTMLFADIQGSTAAAEHLDPEDWAEVMNGAFEHLIAPVYRYEGTLAQLQGDAILAFFGAPIAHEDDPVRAVRAGLEMVEAFDGYRSAVQARIGVSIGVRVGINTGLVVVGEVGSDLRVEYTALGDAINVAARMEQTADPGTVRVTGDTVALLGAAFELVEIGPVEVKGKAEPVVAFRVTGLGTSSAGASSAPPATAPLIGRDAERSALGSAVRDVVAGRGRVCSLVGEAGIGKSRLLSALRADADRAHAVVDRADQPARELAWLEGRCRSYDAGVPYALFVDVLWRWWGLEEPGAPEFERITAAIARALGAPDPDTAALLASTVGVPVPEEHAELVTSLATPVLHQRTTESIVAYLSAEAVRRPVVLVLEDLHWSDALSLALVERLLPVADERPLGLLLATRPHRDEASWALVESAERTLAHRYTGVRLGALTESETRDLIGHLVARTPVDAVARRVLDRANGNPLFVEQLVRALGEAGVRDDGFARRVDVPVSLSGLLTARLDALGEDRRLVAQVASVIGQEFAPEALAALLPDRVDIGATLDELVHRGILVGRSGPGGRRYAFHHALIEETAYSTVLLRTRRELHARLARHLETTEPEAVQEIARHHVAAGDPDRAFPYLVLAGERATRAMALTDAIRAFTAALDAAPGDADADLVVRAHSGLGEAFGLIPDLPRESAAYQRLLDYGRECGQPSVQVLALNRLGIATAEHTGDLAEADRYLSEARRIAETSNDQLGLAEYHTNACYLAAARGELDQAIAHDDETVRLGELAHRPHLRLAGLIRRSLNLLSTLRYEEAQQTIDEAIGTAEDVGARKELLVLRTYRDTHLALRDGDLAAARLAFEEGVPALARLGSGYTPPLQSLGLSTALALGDVEGAIAQAGEAGRAAERLGYGFVVAATGGFLAYAYALCGMDHLVARQRHAALEALESPLGEFFASTVWADLASANLVLGDVDRAGEDFATGLGVSSTTRYWQRPRMLIGSASVALAHTDTRAARRLLDETATFVAGCGLRYYDPDLALGNGRLAAVEGRVGAAGESYVRAQTLAADRGQRLLERDVAAARRDLAMELGRHEEAAVHAAHATRVADGIASTIADEALRAGFRARFQADVEGPTLHGPVT